MNSIKLKLAVLVLLLIPVISFAQDVPKKKAYYFYGEQCPHCKTVDEYFQSSGVYEKYEITKLEVTANPFNGRLFLDFGKSFNVSDWGGVPAIVFGDKYLLGDKPIIDNFEKEIDDSNDANELPNPEKIADTIEVNKENQQPVSVEATTGGGNKKNYLPVVISGLIILGAGALIYINRKK